MMFSDTQRMLRDSVDRLTATDKGPPQDRGETLWAALADRLGVVALPFAEHLGGAGGSAMETAAVVERLGYALAAEPYVSSAVSVAALLNACDTEASRELAVRAATGAVRVGLASETMRCAAGVDRFLLEGRSGLVMGGPGADVMLIATTGADGATQILMLEPETADISRHDTHLLDGTAALELVARSAELPGSALLSDNAAGALAEASEARQAATCAELVGATQAMLDQTVEYTKQRSQFGRPIAQFQVLQHRMAAMHVEVELARSMAFMAAHALSLGPEERRGQLGAATARVFRAARFVAHNAVQLHGGIGTTAELPLGRYLKRIRTVFSLVGPAETHLAAYAAARSMAASLGPTPAGERCA